jgi:trehalose 6-phosphate synthase/phosphatase
MRLLIVSNRLPIMAVAEGDELAFRESVGGLVSGLSSYLDSLKDASFTRSEYLWIGWPGLSIAEERQQDLKARLLEQFHAWPVFVEEPMMDDFYHGFCNKTLWPLFHYFPSYTAYEQASWQTYRQVNQLFCEVVLEIVEPGDIVWVHDYHLMLLPRLLRQRRADIAIGFFLHIPFPTYEVYRQLPSGWRADILDGLLGADLIGLHTDDDAQYLLTCVRRILGIEPLENALRVEQRTVRVGAFPISIDFQRFATALERPAVQQELQLIRERLAGQKAIISVDRLDYSKGLLNRLQGYAIFLERNQQWHGRVTLILVVVPSRIGVEHYQLMRQQIDEAVGRINGHYSSVHWSPVIYQYRYLPFDPLTALYAASDVALITPLRDGMNLVAKEYVATRVDQTGVLILSEMAGAAKELTEAIIINPNNREEIAAAIGTALEMPHEDQVRRNDAMQAGLRRYDVVAWANDFIEALLAVRRGSPPGCSSQ